MGTSMFDDNNNGPALNKNHIVQTVKGLRKSLPPGWIKRREVAVETSYGVRIDIVYEYPDGSIQIR